MIGNKLITVGPGSYSTMIMILHCLGLFCYISVFKLEFITRSYKVPLLLIVTAFLDIHYSCLAGGQMVGLDGFI